MVLSLSIVARHVLEWAVFTLEGLQNVNNNLLQQATRWRAVYSIRRASRVGSVGTSPYDRSNGFEVFFQGNCSGAHGDPSQILDHHFQSWNPDMQGSRK